MLPGLVSAITGAGVGPLTFVGGAVAAKAGATSGTSTIALNSGLTGGIESGASNGDFVIAVFATGSTADRTLSITDGANPYTLLGSELYANDTLDTNLRAAYKFVAGDTSVTFGPTGDVDDGGAMAVYVFRNVNTASPLDVSVVTATGTNSVLANPPSITPTTPGAFIVGIGAGAVYSADTGLFTSSDLTDFLSEDGVDTNTAILGIGHKPDWVSGAFDPSAFSFSPDDGSFSWAALSVAIRPA